MQGHISIWRHSLAHGFTILVAFVLTWSGSVSVSADENPSPRDLPNWNAILAKHHDALDKIESDQEATELFIRVIGPATGLNDSAAAIGAKGIPAQLATELMIPQLEQSAHRLVASLTAWRLATRFLQNADETDGTSRTSFAVPKPILDWLTSQGLFPALSALSQSKEIQDSSHQGASESGTSTSISTAYQLSQQAAQQAMNEWWQLKTWKDRVRVARGRSRLCGTWQWVIHDHKKHHQEQKLSLIFPPLGMPAQIQGLAEIIVLGDVVYLRWEAGGQMQEDSLLFSNEGQRLEGTFVNSQGGWGSITGKRTANCSD